ncbi:MAG: Sec-independent protein translocase protein TatB [Pseudomonadota bacterium]
MFDLGWTELLLIGAVALIVVGPKDLPRMLRTLGQYTGKARGMAREFQRSMEDAAREADVADLGGLKDLGNDIRDATKFDFKEQAARSASSLTNPPKSDALAEFEKVKEKPKDPTPEAAPAQDADAASVDPAPEAAPDPAPEPAAQSKA